MSSNDPQLDSSNNGSKDISKSKQKEIAKDPKKDNLEETKTIDKNKDIDIITDNEDFNNNNNNPINRREFKVIEDGNGRVDASRSLSACLKYYCSGGFGRVGSDIAKQQLELMNKYIKEAAEPLQKRRKKNNGNKFNSIVSYDVFVFSFFNNVFMLF